jgi:hypothetical protein
MDRTIGSEDHPSDSDEEVPDQGEPRQDVDRGADAAFRAVLDRGDFDVLPPVPGAADWARFQRAVVIWADTPQAQAAVERIEDWIAWAQQWGRVPDEPYGLRDTLDGAEPLRELSPDPAASDDELPSDGPQGDALCQAGCDHVPPYAAEWWQELFPAAAAPDDHVLRFYGGQLDGHVARWPNLAHSDARPFESLDVAVSETRFVRYECDAPRTRGVWRLGASGELEVTGEYMRRYRAAALTAQRAASLMAQQAGGES